MRAAFSWITANLGLMLVAFVLAVVVWVSAVTTADPNRQQVSRSVEMQIIGQNSDLLLVNEVASQARLTLQAPQSIWDQLNNNPSLIKTWIDLSGLGPGSYSLPVQARVDASPVRLIHIEPAQVDITLEPLLRRELPVTLKLRGSLPLGYQKGEETVSPGQVEIFGPESLVRQVANAEVVLDISGATSSLESIIPVILTDGAGQTVGGVTVVPREVTAQAPVNLLGGFKNVAVKVVSQGQVANGYRLTNISVSPPTVTIFSNNPEQVSQTPGFVETMPVDINNLTDDLEVAVDLNLPVGVSLVREPNVLVQVSVAAIEGTMTISVPVQVVGLEPELMALSSPDMVDVIVSGPINLLEGLTPEQFRAVLDLTGLPPGVYQRNVEVDLAPAGIQVQTTLPESVEVTIEVAPTPTQTPRGGVPADAPTATPTPTSSPTPTPTPTRRPIIITPTRTRRE